MEEKNALWEEKVGSFWAWDYCLTLEPLYSFVDYQIFMDFFIYL